MLIRNTLITTTMLIAFAIPALADSNNAYVTFSGSNNIGQIDQVGDNNNMEVIITGNNNVYGDVAGDYGYASQRGERNITTTNILGNSNRVLNAQIGSDNELRLSVVGDSSTVYNYQGDSKNKITGNAKGALISAYQGEGNYNELTYDIHNGQLSTVQSGTQNSLSVYGYSMMDITQRGGLNRATVLLQEEGLGSILQQGDGNILNLQVMGASYLPNNSQIGNGNYTEITANFSAVGSTLVGDNNALFVDSTGYGGTTSANIYGNGNFVSSIQKGDGDGAFSNTALLSINGNHNSMRVAQY